MKLRGAVVGCGMISEFHLRGWQRIRDVDLIALVDPARNRAEERRGEFAPNAAIYGSLDDLFAENDRVDADVRRVSSGRPARRHYHEVRKVG